MARTRKEFLAAASAAGAGLAMAGTAQAQSPSPSPKPTPAPTPLARDVAERMRRFDPQLTAKQLDEIAHQVDQLAGLRGELRPKGHGLANGDPPAPQFRVSE